MATPPITAGFWLTAMSEATVATAIGRAVTTGPNRPPEVAVRLAAVMAEIVGGLGLLDPAADPVAMTRYVGVVVQRFGQAGRDLALLWERMMLAGDAPLGLWVGADGEPPGELVDVLAGLLSRAQESESARPTGSGGPLPQAVDPSPPAQGSPTSPAGMPVHAAFLFADLGHGLNRSRPVRQVPSQEDGGASAVALDVLRTRVEPPQVVATIQAETLDALQRATSALASVACHRLVRWILHEVRARETQRGRWIDGSTITIEGGRSALADVLGVDAADVGSALFSLRTCSLMADSRRVDGLITSEETYPSSRCPHRRLTITVSSYLRGGQGTQAIPVPPPNKDPPLVGAPQSHAAQLRMLYLFFAELRRNWQPLLDIGGLPKGESNDPWQILAGRSDLTSGTLPRVLDAWTAGTDSVPPLLYPPELPPWRRLLSVTHPPVRGARLRRPEEYHGSPSFCRRVA